MLRDIMQGLTSFDPFHLNVLPGFCVFVSTDRRTDNFYLSTKFSNKNLSSLVTTPKLPSSDSFRKT